MWNVRVKKENLTVNMCQTIKSCIPLALPSDILMAFMLCVCFKDKPFHLIIVGARSL